MPSRAILTAVATTVAVLQAPTPVRAVNDIPFSITASESGVVMCLGPWRQSDLFCGNKFAGGTTTTFYSADINAFNVFGPWRCDILKPPVFSGCPSHPSPQVWFCLPKPGPGNPPPSVRLTYSNDVLSVNQPLRQENKPCPATSTSFLGQDGEDAVAAAARWSRRSAADGDDVDTFDLEAEAGETVDVTLAVDGSAGGVGEVATVRVLSGSGEAVLAEETGPLPLTLQATLDGPASIMVQTANRGEGVPFMGYYTLDVAPAAGEAEAASAAGGSNEPPDVAPAAGDSDELFPPVFLLVPRGDVEQ